MSGLVKTVTMAIVADPGTSHEQLDELSAKQEELSKPFTLKIVADTGEAQAETDAVTEALHRYQEATVEAEDASARLAEVQSKADASDNEYTAALDRSTEATVRALDAQIRLGEAELEASAKTKEAGDAQVETGAKSGEGALAAEGLASKLKLAALGFVAAGAVGVKMAADVDQQTTRLATSAGESVKNLGMVQRGMLGLSVSTDTSMSQLESGMYLVESAGYHGGQGLLVMKSAAQGAAEEGANLGDVSNALTSALNAYHLPASRAVSITNEMLQAVGQGKMTFQQLAGSLATILPAAAAAHMSFAQVAGGIATMTSQGTSADEATQLLRHTLVALQNPNSVQIQEMQQMGISSNSLAKNIGKEGLTGTISELEDAILHHMGPSGMVLLDAFNKSKLAAQSADEEIQAMPPSLQKLARAYQDGSITVGQWQKMMFSGSLTGEQKNLLEQFAATENAARGFNTQLKAGGGDAQTFTAAMSKVMGGQEGLQVALQVGGAHMSTYKANVTAVGHAATETGANVKDWSLTQHQFNFELGSSEKAAQAAAISFAQALMPAVISVLHPVSEFLGFIAKSSAASTALAVVLGGVLTVVLATKVVGGLKSAATAAETLGGWVSGLAGKFAASGEAATAAMTDEEALTIAYTESGAAADEAAIAQTGLDVAMDANPIGLVVLAVAALIGVIVLVVTHLKDFKQWGVDAFHFVEHGAEDAWNWVKGHWPLLLAILTGPIGIAVYEIKSHWTEIVDGAEEVIHDIESWFGRLPGMVLGWVSSFGHLLWNAGASLLHGLIGGIESEIGNVTGIVEGAGSSILHGIEHSLGIGSPSREMRLRGQFAGQGLALGLTDSISMVEAASQRLAQATVGGFAAGGGHGGVPGHGAGGGDTYIFNLQPLVDPDKTARQIQQLLLRLKRTRGQTNLGLA